MTEADRRAFLEECFPHGLASRELRVRDVRAGLECHRTVDRLALSLLSDAQEKIGEHRSERSVDNARRVLNLVKWMLDERDAFEWLPIAGAPGREAARGRKFLLCAPDWPEAQVAERTGDGPRDWLIHNSPAYEWGRHGPATVFQPLPEKPRAEVG